MNARGILTLRDGATIIGGTYVHSTFAGMVVVAQFFLIHDVQTALKISNLLGGLFLFAVGYLRTLDENLLPRIANGVGTSLIGIIIAEITVLLGG